MRRSISAESVSKGYPSYIRSRKSRSKRDHHMPPPPEFFDAEEDLDLPPPERPGTDHQHTRSPRLSIIERNKLLVIRKSHQLTRKKIADANQRRKENARKSKSKMLMKSKRILKAAAERKKRQKQARGREQTRSLSFRRSARSFIAPNPDLAKTIDASFKKTHRIVNSQPVTFECRGHRW